MCKIFFDDGDVMMLSLLDDETREEIIRFVVFFCLGFKSAAPVNPVAAAVARSMCEKIAKKQKSMADISEQRSLAAKKAKKAKGAKGGAK